MPAPYVSSTVGTEASIVSDEINELFNLAAPPLVKPVVARLVPFNGASPWCDGDGLGSSKNLKKISEEEEHPFLDLPTIVLYTDSGCCTIGRSKQLLPPFRIEHADKISAKHCQVIVQPATLTVHIKDTSTNGTFLNGSRLPKGTMVELHGGDRIQLTKRLPAQDHERSTAATLRRPFVEFSFQRIKETRSLSSLVSSLTCPLCSEVFFRPCRASPCLHAFCAHCISETLKSQRNADENEEGGGAPDEEGQHSRVWMSTKGFKCPVCQQQLHSVRPSYNLETTLLQLLEIEPKRKPTPAKAHEFESTDVIPAGGLAFKRQRGDDSSDENSVGLANGNEDEEEKEWCSASVESWRESNESTSDNVAKKMGRDSASRVGKVVSAFARRVQLYYPQFLGRTFVAASTRCRECDHPSLFDGFQCGSSSSLGSSTAKRVTTFPKHLQCRACWQPFPERPLCPRPQRCFLCASPFCNMYFSSGKKDETEGCAALSIDASLGLKSVEEHIMGLEEGIPPNTFAGNAVEQRILFEYMISNEIPENQLRRDCINGFREGRWHPDVHNLTGVLTVSSPVCRICADSIYASLLFHYRRSIPRDDLPASVTERPHCWGGIQCQAQHQSVTHAERYHHVCYPEKRKE